MLGKDDTGAHPSVLRCGRTHVRHSRLHPNLCEDALKSLAIHYNIQLKLEELLVAKKIIKRRVEKFPDTATVFRLLDGDMFPSLKAVLQVALTIPATKQLQL